MRPESFKTSVKSGKIRDNLVKAWVKGAINPERILWEFSNIAIINEGLRRNGKNAYRSGNEDDENSDPHPLWSFFEMDESSGVFEK